MVATDSPLPPRVLADSEEPRVLLRDVPWSTYVVLRDSLDSRRTVMTYLAGELEIMTKSREHEVTKDRITRLIELFCLERDVPLYGYGEMTVREETRARGLESDQWYCCGKDRDLPDIAIEVVVTNPLIDKLEVYRGLGVREVWIFDDGAFRFVGLRGDHYEPLTASELLPELDFRAIARFAAEPDQHAALKAFRDELRRTR